MLKHVLLIHPAAGIRDSSHIAVRTADYSESQMELICETMYSEIRIFPGERNTEKKIFSKIRNI